MKILLIISLFPTLLLASFKDPKWLIELSQMSEKNKAQHYWASNIGTMVIGHMLYKKTGRIALSCFGGAALMYGVGELKERVWDGYFKKGTNSGGDRFMNFQGCLFAIPQTRVEIDIYQRNQIKETQDLERRKHVFE